MIYESELRRLSTGTRHERSLKAVEEIGPAVFNGGFTTFLALALLGFSTSQIFLTFFKVQTVSRPTSLRNLEVFEIAMRGVRGLKSGIDR